MKRWWLFALVCAAGCGRAHAGDPAASPGVPTPSSPVAFGASSETVAAPVPSPAGHGDAPTPPKARLTVAEARRYMVSLINRDRKTMGLPPVELDEGAPTRAGQAHADDMATNGYLGHWGTDGSVPEQRHTEAGGADMVLENASCFTDEKKRTLDRAPTIAAEQVEKTEGMFFNEVPPNDGHRVNILKPQHRKVGIGIAQPVSTATEIAVPCFSQEFTDPYGSYAPIPKRVRINEKMHVEGTITAPATFGGVGLARADAPRALSAAEANKRRTYLVPPPYQTYWPPGFKTPIPVTVNGAHFAIDVPVGDKNKPGMYEVSVWAKLPGSNDFVIVGLRTLRVE